MPHTNEYAGVYYPAKFYRVSGLVEAFPLGFTCECAQRPVFCAQRQGLYPGNGRSRHD